ncbi:hypothetical protein [Spirosoma sordidisoli]|uniref:Uncharacterized protein n=1 Tax=Spirosoma sordidisoli TaxID=2502893 RepID=A0A4Q2UNT3_9BACT|nr:hypothetical protein [Spirosoma sordidisoli]RYC70502.1 hypothetical protein EQG79_11685 [Spirosoma sordidisoli]
MVVFIPFIFQVGFRKGPADAVVLIKQVEDRPLQLAVLTLEQPLGKAGVSERIRLVEPARQTGVSLVIDIRPHHQSFP